MATDMLEPMLQPAPPRVANEAPWLRAGRESRMRGGRCLMLLLAAVSAVWRLVRTGISIRINP